MIKHKLIMFVMFVRLFMSRNGSYRGIKDKKSIITLELITDKQQFSKVHLMKYMTYLEVLFMNFTLSLTGLSLQIMPKGVLFLTRTH